MVVAFLPYHFRIPLFSRLCHAGTSKRRTCVIRLLFKTALNTPRSNAIVKKVLSLLSTAELNWVCECDTCDVYVFLPIFFCSLFSFPLLTENLVVITLRCYLDMIMKPTVFFV